jgi:hypothetical protein
MEESTRKASLSQRWSEARPTKTLTFWSWVASVVITMLIGFTWGGWVTGGTAAKMAEALVVTRLAPICVAQFKQDPARDQKLKEFKEVSSWGRGEYVAKQGWATLPGEKEPNRDVADECAKLLALISQ